MSIILFKQGSYTLPIPPVEPVPALRARPMIELLVDAAAGQWVDITSYCRSQSPIVCHYGIEGSDPIDRVASSGSLTWDMDNGTRPGVPLGWTSPTSANRMPGWRLNAEIRFSVGTTGGPRTYKFRGALAEAQPDATGPHGPRTTVCTALDWWDVAARLAFPDQPALTNITSDTAIYMILTNLPNLDTVRPPGLSVLGAGSETFALCFDGGSGAALTVRERINQVCLSELGYAYLRGSSDPEGMHFVFEGRQQRSNPTPVFALDDASITALVLDSSRDDVFNHVRVIVHPVVTDPEDVVYALETATTFLAAGARIESLFGAYRSPGSGETAAVTGVVGPFAGTDYTFNSAADGSGTDLTAALYVAPTFTGEGVRFLLINTGAVDGYVTKLQIRAQAIRRTDAQVDRDIPGAEYGARLLELDMAFVSNINTADAAATVFQDRLGQPYARVRAVTFCATRTVTLFEAARTLEPGDAITITESTTGLNGHPFVINAVTWEVHEGGIGWCTWGVEQANAQHVWTLDTDLLDDATTLGF